MQPVCLTVVLLHCAAALYEEPPGGCAGPRDDFTDGGLLGAATPPQRAQRQAAPVKKPVKEEEPAELERELYERQAADQLGSFGADDAEWDEIERQHTQNARFRNLLTTVAGILCVTFAAYKTFEHVKASLPAAPASVTDKAVKKGADEDKQKAVTADTPASVKEVDADATRKKKAEPEAEKRDAPGSDAKSEQGPIKKGKKRTVKTD
jgi:hypothetical protein